MEITEVIKSLIILGGKLCSLLENDYINHISKIDIEMQIDKDTCIHTY